jgi:hypothetical protein
MRCPSNFQQEIYWMPALNFFGGQEKYLPRFQFRLPVSSSKTIPSCASHGNTGSLMIGMNACAIALRPPGLSCQNLQVENVAHLKKNPLNLVGWPG